MLAVLALWTLAHAANRWVLIPHGVRPAESLAFWTFAKCVCWLAPSVLLLRRWGRADAAWLGITTREGLWTAALWSVLWVAIQEGGVRLALPLFARPPPDLRWHALLGSLVIAPCFEELMFRGVMLRLMRQAGGSCLATVSLSALAFAMLHVPGWLFRVGLEPSLLGAFLSIWAFGVVSGLLAWRVPTLWAPILLHFANNYWSTGALAWSLRYFLPSD